MIKIVRNAVHLFALGALLPVAVMADITKIETQTARGWQMVWQDEFNGKDIDASKWGWEQNCWGGGNNELQCYTDRFKNSFVEDGKLIIRAHKETFRGLADVEESGTTEKRTMPYTSARLRTLNKGDWKYGRIEARAKLPAGQGIWPAIWMLPTDWKYGGWAASGEIDIVEMVSQQPEKPNKEIHGTIHYGKEWPNNVFSGESYTFQASDPTREFHTYALEWSDSELRWYVDDVHYATQRATGWYSQIKDAEDKWYNVEGSAPFDQRFHLLLNVAVGGNWPGSPDETTRFPVQMEVDYVRVYSCPETPDTLTACESVGPDAKFNPGQQPPVINDMVFDPDFIRAPVVSVFDDDSVVPFMPGTYVSNGSIQIKNVEVPGRGVVSEITFNTNQGVAYWQGPQGFDFREFTALEFDLRRVADPRTGGRLFMKMDCFFPCGTGDVDLELAPVGEWARYRFALRDLVRHPGSTLDLKNVNTPLVIFPNWDNQEGVVLQLDNIRFVR